MVLQLLGTSCWYHDNGITKFWALSSYFLYLYIVFFQHCFHLEQHYFHIDRQFSCSPNISNWLSQIPTKSSLVIQNSCYSDYPVLYQNLMNSLQVRLYDSVVFRPLLVISRKASVSWNIVGNNTNIFLVNWFTVVHPIL